jgi:two-component system invasion response regulator UvrY
MKKLLLVDDHAIVRSGLRTLFVNQNLFDEIDEADNGKLAYELSKKNDFDLIIMDVSMQGVSGIDSAAKILKFNSKQNILILTMHDSDLMIKKAKKMGVKGFVMKSDISENLIKAVVNILDGANFFPESLDEFNPIEILNEREFEVFKMVASGQSLVTIAENLNISMKTVSNYQTSIKQKLNLSNPIDFYKLALEFNLIES